MDTESVHTLDVRSIPHTGGARRDRILGAWHDLSVGDTLRIVNDHDPVPLKYLFQAEYAGQHEWAYEQEGPAEWIVQIKRVAGA